MAIGTISTPATWLNGTVAPASWFQSVQDDVNALLTSGATLKGLYIDGTGGAALTNPSAHVNITGGTAPGIAAGTGAGTGPTGLTITGNDCIGIISLTTGTAPAAGGTIVTVTFANAYGTSPNILILPVYGSTVAASLSAQVVAGTSGGASFILSCLSGAAGLAASSYYAWYYLVIGRG